MDPAEERAVLARIAARRRPGAGPMLFGVAMPCPDCGSAGLADVLDPRLGRADYRCPSCRCTWVVTVAGLASFEAGEEVVPVAAAAAATAVDEPSPATVPWWQRPVTAVDDASAAVPGHLAQRHVTTIAWETGAS